MHARRPLTILLATILLATAVAACTTPAPQTAAVNGPFSDNRPK